MTKKHSRLTVMDFVIAVLDRHERELDKNLERLEQVTEKLEKQHKTALVLLEGFISWLAASISL